MHCNGFVADIQAMDNSNIVAHFQLFGVCICLSMVVVSHDVELNINITNQTLIPTICLV